MEKGRKKEQESRCKYPEWIKSEPRKIKGKEVTSDKEQDMKEKWRKTNCNRQRSDRDGLKYEV